MRLPPPDKNVRVIGFDDAPFVKRPGARVPLCGVVCAGTRFEGMVWGQVRRDGWGATDEVIRLLNGGKFLPQVHLVLLDGLAFGGFNVVDLPRLSETLERPCVAVMRKLPNLAAVEAALGRLPRPERRMELFRRAGVIHQSGPFVFQVAGADPERIGALLPRLTDRGFVPEALRLAHLIGSAVRGGESGRRALARGARYNRSLMIEHDDAELAQARDPCTPASQLRHLAANDRAELRVAVAANPNVPLDLLLTLAEDHADGCVQNPLLPLALLEDPALLRKLSWRVLYGLTAASPSDAALIGALVEAFEATSSKGFLRDGSLHQVALLFLRNPATPPELLERVGADRLDQDAVLAAHPGASPRLLRGLLASDVVEVRTRAARHASAPAGFLALLRRCGVGHDMLLPEPPLGSLSETEFCDLVEAGPFTWRLAARHPGLAPDALDRLARGPSLAGCGAVVARASSPATALQRAIDETEIFFRFLRRPDGPGSPWKTAPDPRVFLRLGLALRPDTPPRMLRLLIDDPEPSVWRAVRERPGLPIDAQLALLQAHPFELTGPALASADTPAPLLALVAQHHRRGLRRLTVDEARMLVRHPGSPPEALDALAGHADPMIRRAIALRRADPAGSGPQPPARSSLAPPPAPQPGASLIERLLGSWRRR